MRLIITYIVKTKFLDKEENVYCTFDLKELEEKTINDLIVECCEDKDREYCSCSFNESQNHCDCGCGDWGYDYEIIDKSWESVND